VEGEPGNIFDFYHAGYFVDPESRNCAHPEKFKSFSGDTKGGVINDAHISMADNAAMWEWGGWTK